MVLRDSIHNAFLCYANPFASARYDDVPTTEAASSPSSVRKTLLLDKNHYQQQRKQQFVVAQQQQQPPKKLKKRVRIVEAFNTYHEGAWPLMVPTDIAHQWYSKEELILMRQNRSALINEIITADQKSKSRVTFQTVLIEAFRDCCQQEQQQQDSKNVKQDTKDDYDDDNEEDEDIYSPSFFPFLSRMLEICPSRTGMESLGVPLVAMRQQARRSELRRSIQYMQQQHCRRHIMGGKDQLQECLRHLSETCSRPSRLYAGLIARAHAEATCKA